MKKTSLLFAIMTLLVSGACNRSADREEQQLQDSLTALPDTLSGEKKELVEFKLFFTLANLPSPLELINSIYHSDIPFNSELLNSPDNETRYVSAYKKAVNYGVYGVDMAYAAFYGQNQDLINQFMVAKKMAGRLNLSETFDQYTSQFERNQGNKDSLITIIDRAYAETDDYLRTNNRSMAAAQTLAGAVIEVQYITLQVMLSQTMSDKNNRVFENIYKQKMYIDNLISLMEELKADKDCAKLLADLQEEKKVFDTIGTAADLTPANMAKLADAVSKTRKGIVS
ncbi:MAG: hypothetical protein RL213_2032 [Bacteroidota bacterium]|jgi:hypothetical protein